MQLIDVVWLQERLSCHCQNIILVSRFSQSCQRVSVFNLKKINFSKQQHETQNVTTRKPEKTKHNYNDVCGINKEY